MPTTFKFDPRCDASTPYHAGEHVTVSSGRVALRINEYTTISLPLDEYESIAETANIMGDASLMAAIHESEQEIEDGNVISWEDAKKELGLLVPLVRFVPVEELLPEFGAYYTPKEILDPACGSGSFLADFIGNPPYEPPVEDLLCE
jgi:hypothetical protein